MRTSNSSKAGIRRGICKACVRSSREEPYWNVSRIGIIVSSLSLLTLGLFLEFVLCYDIPALILFVMTSALSGYRIAREALEELARGRASIDLLVIIAAIGAFLIGHGEEGAAVLFLFYIAESLEDYAAERAGRSIRSLMELAPEVATVLRHGEMIIIPVEEVQVGDIILVKPGERIPLDGVVVRGSSTVNQAPITGESRPIPKDVGDEVCAGTLNNEGFLEVRVTRRAEDTMLAKIVQLVKEAQQRKSRAERFIDKLSRYYTPLVILLALLVALVPASLGLSLIDWTYRALVLLTISCPCALALSTPVAIASGITSAARNGVLIKGGAYVEEIGKVQVFAFDKTGTLTKGELEVTDIIPINCSAERLVSIAASIEAASEHPIGQALLRYARRRGIRLRHLEHFKAIPGKGAEGKLEGIKYYVGSIRLFRELGSAIPEEAFQLENRGRTVILVGTRDTILGIIGLMD